MPSQQEAHLEAGQLEEEAGQRGSAEEAGQRGEEAGHWMMEDILQKRQCEIVNHQCDDGFHYQP